MKLNIASGSEYLLPFAKKKLAVLKDELTRGGISIGSRYVYVDSTQTVFVKTMKCGDMWLDEIRITGGISYLLNLNIPFPIYTEVVNKSSSRVGVIPNNVDTFGATYEGFIDGVSQGAFSGGAVSNPTVPVTGDRIWTATNWADNSSTFSGSPVTGLATTPGGYRLWNGTAELPGGPGISGSEIAAYTTYETVVVSPTAVAALKTGFIVQSWINQIAAASLDIPLPDQETITLVPYSPFVGGVDLGIYGSHAGATQAAVYGKGVFRYQLSTNSFIFSKWTDAPQILTLTAAYPAGNLVVKYGRAVGSTANTFAKAQAKTLLSPVSAGDKFLKLVKSAVGI